MFFADQPVLNPSLSCGGASQASPDGRRCGFYFHLVPCNAPPYINAEVTKAAMPSLVSSCLFGGHPGPGVDAFELQHSSHRSSPCPLSISLLRRALTSIGCALNYSFLSRVHLVVPTTPSFTPSVCRRISGIRPGPPDLCAIAIHMGHVA